MKKTIYMMILISVIGLCCGCNKAEPEVVLPGVEGTPLQTEEALEEKTQESTQQSAQEQVNGQESIASPENSETAVEDIGEIDFTADYSEDIKADVAHVVSNSASLQEELEHIEQISEKYTPLAQQAQTQLDMNLSSEWFFMIWDAELNNLWSRFSDSADQQTKERVLAEQRNWIAMKEEVILLSLGPAEENGSMYPLLQNAFLEEITRSRAYVLANELAKIKGESFVLPERSEKYGLFVDNQDTGDIYSYLLTRQGWEDTEEAILSIHRLGHMEGTFVDNGNGELTFTAEDGSVKGSIRINGWTGASFEVTETVGQTPFTVGEIFEFPFVF